MILIMTIFNHVTLHVFSETSSNYVYAIVGYVLFVRKVSVRSFFFRVGAAVVSRRTEKYRDERTTSGRRYGCLSACPRR